MKFGRTYIMTVEGRERSHTIAFPLTCRLRIQNASVFSLGAAVFQIYNLAENVRADLYKDPYEQLNYKPISFAAGYTNDSAAGQTGIELPIIFQGNVTLAYSYRNGPDWVTEIHGLDGGFAVDNGNSIQLTKPSPYSLGDAFGDIIQQMPNVKLGVIGSFDIQNTRGISFAGNAWDAITQMVAPLQGYAFINKEKVYILRQWEYIEDEGQLEIIQPETGLIGTPRIQSGIVQCRLIFEPRLSVLQRVRLEVDELRMSGDYTVLMIAHSGTISGAICEALETEVTIYQPDRLPEKVA